MTNTICLNKNSSITRLLTTQKPIIENSSEDKFATVLFLPESKDRKGEGGLRTKGYFKKSYEDKPLISIVTVVYNGKRYLDQTINSVLDQGYDNVEYIIIDGGSTDGTLDIVKKYDAKIDYWVSESDTGIYNAMNKGITLCTGEYISFINADDWYNQDSLEIVVNTFQKIKVDYIISNQADFKDNNHVNTFKANMHKYKARVPCGHPSFFVKHKFMLEYGFNESYSIVADYDFMLKVIKKSTKFKLLDLSLSNFRLGGVSTTTNVNFELFKVRLNHFGLLYATYIYIWHSILKLMAPLLRFFKKILPSRSQ